MNLRPAIKRFLAAFFALAGLTHFINPQYYMRMMPDYLPWHGFMVLASGALETILGLLLLFSRTEKSAASGLIALLFLIFPANIHMALHPGLFPEIPPLVLWLRLPLQFALGALIYWAADLQSRRNPETG